MFACMLFMRMRTNSICLPICCSNVRVRIGRVFVYGILVYADEKPVFANTLFVRIRTHSKCLSVRYSYGFGRIARFCVYASRAYAEE